MSEDHPSHVFDHASTRGNYLALSREYEVLARSTRSLRTGVRYRKMAAACLALAKEEEWLSGKIDPLMRSESR
ncbi:MAG TPA: hypothetical protein VFQ27_13905 [Xanthobacteraceae bacterium]|nr:hypothetical protein [Xanthobacteraceae bacterium]